MYNKLINRTIVIIFIVILYILYKSLHLVNMKVESFRKGIGKRMSRQRQRQVVVRQRKIAEFKRLQEQKRIKALKLKKQRLAGIVNTQESSLDKTKIFSKINNVNTNIDSVNKRVTKSFNKINSVNKSVMKSVNDIKNLENLPIHINKVVKSTSKFPDLINKLVSKVERNINYVDKVANGLCDVVQIIETEIKGSIDQLENVTQKSVSEILKLKKGLIKFIKGIANIFVNIFEILLKIISFIGNLPNCLLWYIGDAWDIMFKSIAPNWIIWFNDAIFIPFCKLIIGIIKIFLSLFGFDFNIDNSQCYNLNIKQQTQEIEASFESVGDFFTDVFR